MGEMVLQVCKDLRQWLEQLSTLLALYHVHILDLMSHRNRLQVSLDQQKAKFMDGENRCKDAELRQRCTEERWKEEKMKQRAEALLGIQLLGEDAKIYSQRDVDEMKKEWEKEHVDPLLEELRELRKQREEMLGKSGNKQPRPSGVKGGPAEEALGKQQVGLLVAALNGIAERIPDDALNSACVHLADCVNQGGGDLADVIKMINKIPLPSKQNSPSQSPKSGGGAGAAATVQYHTVVPATITFLPHDRQPFYMACPAEVPDSKGEGKMRTCNKKVERIMNDGGWCCAADHRSPEPHVRWMSNFAIADQSGSQFVSAFDEVGQKILGRPAADAARLWEAREQDEQAAAELERLFREAQYKRWRLRVKAHKEMWNDEERLKVTVVDCNPVGFQAEARTKLREVMVAIASDPLDGHGNALAHAAAPAGA